MVFGKHGSTDLMIACVLPEKRPISVGRVQDVGRNDVKAASQGERS